MMSPELQVRVREGHPEVTFRLLAGAPLDFNKSSSEGKGQRLRILVDLGVRFDPTAETTPSDTRPATAYYEPTICSDGIRCGSGVLVDFSGVVA